MYPVPPVGWPVMLATSERGAFVRKVHGIKEKELVKLLNKDGVPLRPDVKQVGVQGLRVRAACDADETAAVTHAQGLVQQ